MPRDCKKELEERIEFLCESYGVTKDEIYGSLKDVLLRLGRTFSLLIFQDGKVLNLLEENHFLYPKECWNPPFVTVRMLNSREFFVRIIESLTPSQLVVLKELVRTYPVDEIYVEVYDRELYIKAPCKIFKGFELRKFLSYLRQFLKP